MSESSRKLSRSREKSLEQITLELCKNALAEGRTTLLEPEVYALLRKGGLNTPQFYTIRSSDKSLEEKIQPLSSRQVVLKVVSPEIVHKRDMGGVRVVDNDTKTIVTNIHGILADVKDHGGQALLDSVREIMISEFVESNESLGSQLLAGVRWLPDMGHIIAIGFGGVEADELNQYVSSGEATVLISPQLLDEKQAMAKLSRSFVYRKVEPRTSDEEQLKALLSFLYRLAIRFSDAKIIIQDFEVNPLFVSKHGLTAVDAFFRFSTEHLEEAALRDNIKRVLEPKTIAVIGVSKKEMNAGRMILQNVIKQNFPKRNIRVIRKDCETLDSIRCTSSVHELPWYADLVIVAVPAQGVPDVMADVVGSQNVGSVILISSGTGETESGKEVQRKTEEIIERARKEGIPVPVIVGPNSLGIRSSPGSYNSLFIPDTKFPEPEGSFANTAFVCQSGAFMITRMNELPFLNPRYAISTGNQMDLTVTDFVETLLEEKQTEVFALYIEGFKSLEGLRLARLVKHGGTEGKDFVIYKAGRTSEGITATSSHTASRAGDYLSCVEVLNDAGALVASTFDELKAYLLLASLMREKTFQGLRLGAISNAGFETVGIADTLLKSSGFSLPELSPHTRSEIGNILHKASIRHLTTVRNPLDLTPMATDEVHTKCLKAILEDGNIDAVILSMVPLTPAMKTLPPGVDEKGIDSIDDPTSVLSLVGPVVASSPKPVVTVVDAGHLYDPLVHSLQMRGVPCFRSADFAAKILQRFIQHKLSPRDDF